MGAQTNMIFFSNTDEYWIFKIRGNKDKINPLLRYIDDEVVYHKPKNALLAKSTLLPRIIEITNEHGTHIIKN